jgi:hypothetical protein
MKSIVGYVAAAAVLAVAAWIGTYLFWHIRLVSAVRTLESKAGTTAAEDAADVVDSAGCRALPYLVGALDGAKNQIFVIYATGVIVRSIEEVHARNAMLDATAIGQARGWKVVPEDNPMDMKIKSDSIRAYWKEYEPVHHKWWRVWSSTCTP